MSLFVDVFLCRAKWALEWFHQIFSVQHELEENRKQFDRRITVAILDAGIDATHKEMQKAKAQGSTSAYCRKDFLRAMTQ